MDPATNVTWTSEDGTEVYSTNEPEGANVTLRISTRDDYGLYDCTATNEFGMGIDTIEIAMPGRSIFLKFYMGHKWTQAVKV